MELPDADLTDLGYMMLQTRIINDYLGTAYRVEDVAEMDPLAFVILSAVKQGMAPTPGKKEEAPRG